VESETYQTSKQEVLAALGKNAGVYEDFELTFQFVLARKPEFYPLVVQGLNVRMFKSDTGILPSVRVWYTCVETPPPEPQRTVTLLYVGLITNGHAHD